MQSANLALEILHLNVFLALKHETPQLKTIFVHQNYEQATMTNRLNNAEDKLFKETFSRPEFAKELLLRRAPPELLATLQLDTLELTNASFVDKELAEHFADLVFNCRTSSDEEAKVSFLLEHKSYAPPNPPLQIICYQANGWRQQIKSKLKPAPIIPVMFYHGIEPWKELPWKDYLVGMAPAFEPYTPEGRYILIDLTDLSDDEILQFRYGFLKTVLLMMKHRLEREYMLENLTNMLTFVEEEVEIELMADDFHIILRYLRASASLDWKEVRERVRPLFKTNAAMTVLEEIKEEMREEMREEMKIEFKQEGIKEGIEVGIEVGIKKGIKKGYALKTKETVMSLLENFPDQPDEKIAKVAKVDVVYVQTVRLEMKNEQKPGI